MKSEDLVAMMDFLYLGETTLYQENLETFLNIAAELGLKGLNNKPIESKEDMGDSGKKGNSSKQPDLASFKKHFSKKKTFQRQIQSEKDITSSELNPEGNLSNELTVALSNQNVSGEFLELEEQIKALIGRSDNMLRNGNRTIRAYVCQVCGKEGFSRSIKYHIKVHHIVKANQI